MTTYKHSRKRLMPKSAVLVRRYERQIKTVFVAFIAALMIMFLAREPYIGIGSGARTDARLQPAEAERLQGIKALADTGEPVRAAFVVLAREDDLWSLVTSIRHVEDRFNERYQYDWVFVGATPLSEKFRAVTSSLVSGRARFCEAQPGSREYPPTVDQERADNADALSGAGVSPEQIFDWRYHAGYLALLPEMQEYEYYWYVEPDIELYCDINYDIFRFMKSHRKKYGFILATEDRADWSALWSETAAFMKQHPDLLAHDNLRAFVSNDDGGTFNGCVFRAGFQIASLDFWRSDAYRALFAALDASGGFFYNAWTDMAVQTLAVALLMHREEVHFFDSIGLYHRELRSCPFEAAIRRQNKCICDPALDQTWENGYFCTRKFMQARELRLPGGVRRRARAI
ncbi:AaceriADR048Wp [[Ashbya] aceris (nom. inval.)]|nr:AaceriADR048Wp [[Ashbya] aceris (nom. inval.)]